MFSLPELQQVLTNMGTSATEGKVARMMQQADQDEDGLISFQEFVVMMTK